MIVSIPVWLTMFFSACQNCSTSGHDISLRWMSPPQFVRHCILMRWFPKGDIITRGVIFFMLSETLSSFFFLSNLLLLSFIFFLPFLSENISFKNNILGNYWPLLPLVETKSHTAFDSEIPRNKSFTFQLINPFFQGCFAILFQKKGLQQHISSCVTLITYFNFDFGRIQNTETS